MKLIIKETVDGKLYRTHTLEGDESKVYRQFYDMERSARYDWHRHYEFETQAERDLYQNWKSKNETFEMFYGGATVD